MNPFIDKKTLATFIIIPVIIIIIVIYQWFNSVNLPAGSNGKYEIEIKEGMPAGEIGELLYSKGIIRSVFFFKVVSRMYRFSRQFKAGVHILKGKMSLTELARLLTRNPPIPPDIRVTVIEGLTIQETASVLEAGAGIDSARFAELAIDSSLAEKLGVDNNTLEGYLYPDTYFVRPRTSPYFMITRMVTQFNRIFNDSLKNRAMEIGMTIHEVVTLASIIETEVSMDDERPLVSSVFHKRLKMNRPLEANPTVQYAIGSKRRLLYEDLKFQSPYNTYIHPGLPPGPIASPGEKSLRAALYPAKTDYLYFVSDGEGGHVFSRTIAEHKRSVRRYRTVRKQSDVQ